MRAIPVLFPAASFQEIPRNAGNPGVIDDVSLPVRVPDDDVTDSRFPGPDLGLSFVILKMKLSLTHLSFPAVIVPRVPSRPDNQ